MFRKSFDIIEHKNEFVEFEHNRKFVEEYCEVCEEHHDSEESTEHCLKNRLIFFDKICFDHRIITSINKNQFYNCFYYIYTKGYESP